MSESIQNKRIMKFHKENNRKNSKFMRMIKWIIGIIYYIILEYILIKFFNFSFSESIYFGFTLLILSPIIYLIINDSLLIIITLLSYKRTNYSGFIYETIVDLEVILVCTLFIYALLYLKDYFLIIGISSAFLVRFSYFFLEKPLAWTKSSYSNTIDFKSDILFKQSLEINDFQDGFSSRPLFEDLSLDFNENNQESNDIRFLVNYAHFLSQKGDLLAYEIKENKLLLFLRTSFLRRSELTQITLFYKKVFQVIRKKNLSIVTIDLNINQINIKLNKLDYDTLDNVTYTLFAQRMLKQFKQSLKEYLKGNYAESYNVIDPIIEKKNPIDSLKKNIFGIFLFYFIGIISIGSILVFFSNQVNNLGLEKNLLPAFIWPNYVLFLCNILLFNVDIFTLNPLNKLLFDNFPLIGIIVVITFVITAFLYSHIYPHRLNSSDKEFNTFYNEKLKAMTKNKEIVHSLKEMHELRKKTFREWYNKKNE